MAVFQKTNIGTTLWPSYTIPGYKRDGTKSTYNSGTHTSMFTLAIFIRVKVKTQLRSLLKEKQMRKCDLYHNVYIYTHIKCIYVHINVEFYSTVKGYKTIAF